MTVKAPHVVLALLLAALAAGLTQCQGPTDKELQTMERLGAERARVGLLARRARLEADSSAERARVAVADAQAARQAIPKARVTKDTVYIEEQAHAADSAVADLVGKLLVAVNKDSIAIAELQGTIVKKDLALSLYADSLAVLSDSLIHVQGAVIERVTKRPRFGAKQAVAVGGAIGLLAGLVVRR